MTYEEILKLYPRLAICGGPRTGKSTLARSARHAVVLHTDDLMHLPWDQVPTAIVRQVDQLPAYVVEGVQAARALRNYGLQADAVIYLQTAMAPQSTKHVAMARGIHTVFAEWRASNRHIPVFAAVRGAFVRA